MPIYINGKNPKIYLGNHKAKKIYLGSTKVYSSGNIVTYVVDSNVSYSEEVDSDASCLSPTTFVPTKTGWTFTGWRENNTASSDVLTSKVMGDDPITLYAVFEKEVVVTFNNDSMTNLKTIKNKYYNNGNIANPSFLLNQANKNGWNKRGWGTDPNNADAPMVYKNNTPFSTGDNVTLYGLYSQNITVTYYNDTDNHYSVSNTRYFNSSNKILDPTFIISQASKSDWSPIGWGTDDSANSTVAYGNNTPFTVSENTTIYGKYQSVVNVRFINPASSYGNPTTVNRSDIKYYNNGNISNPTFQLEQNGLSGWNAVGWSTDTSATGAITYGDNAVFERDSDVTLYGRYNKVVTLTYNGNGGSGNVNSDSLVAYYNASNNSYYPTFGLRQNGYGYPNGSFLYWQINGANYGAGGTVTLGDNATAYAKWSVTMSASQSVACNTIDRYDDNDYIKSDNTANFSIVDSVPLNTPLSVTIIFKTGYAASDFYEGYVDINTSGGTMRSDNFTGALQTKEKSFNITISNRNASIYVYGYHGSAHYTSDITYNWSVIV